MSYDPNNYGSDVPPPDYGSAAPLPVDTEFARQRTRAAGIALIVVAVLNLLFAVFLLISTIRSALQSPEELQKAQQSMIAMLPEDYQKEMQKQQGNQRPEDLKTQTMTIDGIATALFWITALLTLLAGIRMLSLRSYGLCIIGAICAALPCLSCGGCCGLGEIIGLWALIVLLSGDVRAAFR